MPQGIICFLLCLDSQKIYIHHIFCELCGWSKEFNGMQHLSNKVVGVVGLYTEKYTMGNALLLLDHTPEA